MKNISVFKNFTRVEGYRELGAIVMAIQSGVYKKEIIKIREAIKKEDIDRKDLLKKKLLGFTVSGKFEGGRTLRHLSSYNPLVVLDIDGLKQEALDEVKKSVPEISFTYAGFVSPSGNGYKIIVRTNSTIENHVQVFNQIADYYETRLKVKVDRSGKDVMRLCFMSWDPAAFINPDSKIFELRQEAECGSDSKNGVPVFPTKVNTNSNEGWKEQLENCLLFTEQKLSYKKGNRNNFIYLFASNANRAGVPSSKVIRFLENQELDISSKEMLKTVESAYKTQMEERGARKPNKKKQSNQIKPLESSIDDLLQKAPFFSESIYKNLPDLLKKGCSVFSNLRQRDVFLTGALTIISGCLPEVKGLYNSSSNYPNLYSFVIAPASSGKSGLRYAMLLGNAYHRHLIQCSKDNLMEYELAMLEYQQKIIDFKKTRKLLVPEQPEKPAFERLYIPANTSASMVIKHLGETTGAGIICETEADTLGNTLKQDWGGYSDVLRKAFHFERISYSRKTDSEYLEIEEPKLSVALSGTPGQVSNLIPSSEDGLFSRFLFYVFSVEAKWLDVSPKSNALDIGQYMNELSEEVLELAMYLKSNPTIIELTGEQWELLNNTFSEMLRDSNAFVGATADSIVKRLGVILHRVVMIFTAIRKFENKDKSSKCICSDDDFIAALKIVETFHEHAILLLEKLPKNKQAALSHMPNKRRTFFDALPKSFGRKEAQDCGEALGIGIRTIDRYLNKFMSLGFLFQSQYGMYEKGSGPRRTDAYLVKSG